MLMFKLEALRSVFGDDAVPQSVVAVASNDLEAMATLYRAEVPHGQSRENSIVRVVVWNVRHPLAVGRQGFEASERINRLNLMPAPHADHISVDHSMESSDSALHRLDHATRDIS